MPASRGEEPGFAGRKGKEAAGGSGLCPAPQGTPQWWKSVKGFKQDTFCPWLRVLQRLCTEWMEDGQGGRRSATLVWGLNHQADSATSNKTVNTVKG